MKTEFMEACNMKILVIEDEKLLADSIKTLLEGKGFEVEVAPRRDRRDPPQLYR